MTLDPRATVRPGQRLAVAAEQINFLNRMMRGTAGLSGGPIGSGFSAPYTWLYAKNSTGYDLARWGVMEITGLEVTPTSDDSDAATSQFCEMPVLAGSEIAESAEKTCVAIEPIKSGQIGRVAVAGVVQVTAESLEVMREHVSVIWEGVSWALVRIGSGGGGAVRLGKTTATWARGTSQTIQVWDKGEPLDEEISSPLNEITAYNQFYDVAACVWVIVQKTKLGWYLVEAAVPEQAGSSGCAAPNISGHDLTTIEGYASNKKQALTHDDNACLQWTDIEECS